MFPVIIFEQRVRVAEGRWLKQIFLKKLDGDILQFFKDRRIQQVKNLHLTRDSPRRTFSTSIYRRSLRTATQTKRERRRNNLKYIHEQSSSLKTSETRASRCQ